MRVEAAALSIPKAQDLARRLIASQIPYAKLVDSCRVNSSEGIIVDVEVELPQLAVHDIRTTERVLILFPPQDLSFPSVHTLRRDFPEVPHLLLTEPGDPRSLCLYEEPYRDVCARLTMPVFVERVREWLRLTARGELHAADQPLERLLIGGEGLIIVPHDILGPSETGETPTALSVSVKPSWRHGVVLVADHAAREALSRGLLYAASVFRARPRRHGLIRERPATLAQLDTFLRSEGDDLIGFLRAIVRGWCEVPAALDARFVLIVVAPKIRHDGGDIETHDVWAFITLDKVGTIGERLGVMALHEGKYAPLLVAGEADRLVDVKLHLLNVIRTMPREDVAYASGRSRAEGTRIVGIGAGALGSQLILTAARIGFGVWTIVDSDIVLPHNLVRHALHANAVGESKAEALAGVANALSDDNTPAFSFLNADVLEPGENLEQWTRACDAADLVLDMSASVTVARSLARDESASRRASLFLNPRGTDLILLSEAADRSIRLDALEMQYYRAILTDAELASHLEAPGGRVRYGRSCRDVSARLSQETVGLHAAIGARAVRELVASDQPAIRVWQTKAETGETRLRHIVAHPVVQRHVGEWVVVTDDGLLRRLADLRVAKVPVETGGVLLGTYDLERRTVYIVDTIPAPPDSEERPTWFIRGSEGLPAEVDQAVRRCGEQLQYAGEWHSHPPGHSCAPSMDDAKLFAWVTQHMDRLGLPATMFIVGEPPDFAVFVGSMVAGSINDENRIAIINGVLPHP